MALRVHHRTFTAFVAPGMILLLLSACAAAPTPASAVNATAMDSAAASTSEVVIYASDLTPDALSELYFSEDPASPGGTLITLRNNGDELDPPPENDPHATFTVAVASGIPYRCWIHMKVGEPKGRSTANIAYVQFSKSVDEASQEVFRLSTNSYLTAHGPTQPGWAWVRCDADDAESLVYFESGGQTKVRIQAGAEGVGFDQFLLSPAEWLNSAPSDPVVPK